MASLLVRARLLYSLFRSSKRGRREDRYPNMKSHRFRAAWAAGAVCAWLLAAASLLEPCTIAVLSGRCTRDGRPLLWKNRDVAEQDNSIRFFSGNSRSFIGICDVGDADAVFAGINSAGFAILNSAAEDMEGESGEENGSFMKRALEECATVDDFEALLMATNGPGRQTLANFGVIDARGGAAMFEAGNTSYTRYDAGKASLGYLVRTNFAITGIHPEYAGGYLRFDRAHEILNGAAAAGAIDARFILDRCARDLVNEAVNPYPLPYEGSDPGHPWGFLRTVHSINRAVTASAVVFHGVLPGEDPLLATMWAILGEPVCGVALPLWLKSADVSHVLGGSPTSPLRDAVKLAESLCYTDPASPLYIDTYRLVSETGQGLWPRIGRLEDVVFKTAGAALAEWRSSPPTPGQVRELQSSLGAWAFDRYLRLLTR